MIGVEGVAGGQYISDFVSLHFVAFTFFTNDKGNLGSPPRFIFIGIS